MTPLFTGKERDAETGLNYFGARYMSAAYGRFTSPDPIFITRQRIGDPQQWNSFNYARNNPFLFVDPDGRDIRITVTNVPVGKSYVNRFTQREIQASRGALQQVRETVPTYRIVVTNDSGSSFASQATRDTNRAGDIAQTRGSYGPNQEAPPGAYSGAVRTDGAKGFRIELSDVDKPGTGTVTGPAGERGNIQIHIGAGCSEGCMLLPGGAAARDSFQTAFESVQDEDRRNGNGTAVKVIVIDRNPQPIPSILPSRLEERTQP